MDRSRRSRWTEIRSDPSKAFEILKRYPKVERAVDPTRLGASIAKKYPHGPEILDGEVFDLYTALLMSETLKQEGQNQATPEGVLVTIDELVGELRLNQAARASLGTKLRNLRTSSLWDTLAELVLAAHLVENMKGYTVAIEYPLDPKKPVGQGKDADVAILDASRPSPSS